MKAIFYTAILGLMLASPVSAGGFIASPQDYATNADYAQAYAKSAQDMRDGKFVGRCYAVNSGWGCGYPANQTVFGSNGPLSAMDRKVMADSGNTDGSNANTAK